jgi:hypothetical protein
MYGERLQIDPVFTLDPNTQLGQNLFGRPCTYGLQIHFGVPVAHALVPVSCEYVIHKSDVILGCITDQEKCRKLLFGEIDEFTYDRFCFEDILMLSVIVIIIESVLVSIPKSFCRGCGGVPTITRDMELTYQSTTRG